MDTFIKRMKTQELTLLSQCKTNTCWRSSEQKKRIRQCMYLFVARCQCVSKYNISHTYFHRQQYFCKMERKKQTLKKKKWNHPRAHGRKTCVVVTVILILSVKTPKTVLYRVLRGNSNYISSTNCLLLFKHHPSLRLFTC